MLDYIACIIIRFLNRVFSLIPISISLGLGKRIGTLVFLFNKKRRLIAYANLKAAFSKEKSPKELKNLTKRVYQNLAQTFMEILNLTKVNKEYIDKYVKVINLERIDNASKSERGTILLTAHFGDWELSSLTSAIFGYPILVLAREQKMKRLNELLNRLRESKGCKVVRKGISTKNILKALYDKEMVGILADQDAGKNGIFVNFFGRPTSTPPGAMEMAKRTGSIILPNFIVRIKGPYHKLFLEEYIDFRLGKGDDDIKENLQKYVALLESYIRKYPDQWLWLHKRWKTTPIKTILVLNDGRPGHLNQSLSVAHAIQRARTTQGYNIDDTKIVTVDVKFKNKFFRKVLSSCAALSSWRCHGCMGCMKMCLEKGTYDVLMKTYAEFVVSCGTGLAPLNIFMAIENNAKNIVVMKPDIMFGLRKFKLAIIPNHDNPPAVKNVLSTIVAPNLVEADNLKSAGEALGRAINIENRNVFGLLLGGDNPEFSLTVQTIEKVIECMIKSCEKYNAELLVATSRRTPMAVESMLKDKLKNYSRCKLLVIANEKNVDNVINGILYLSRIIIVSGESMSMISEAISSGKKTIAFELEKKNNVLTKHEKALRELEKAGYLRISGAKDLGCVIEEAWNDSKAVKELGDKEKIFEAVRRLI